MKTTPLTRPAGDRCGFTLLELLIVIAIIAVLASMSLGAYWKVIQAARDAACKTEMSELSTALADFYSRFGALPPSDLTLASSLNAMPAPSRTFIQKCWPRIQPTGLNWGVSGRLSGDQVLVFCLGGIQAGSSGQGVCLGFSDDPQNPTRPGGTRIRPFYDFQSNRLVQMGGGRGRGFSYTDAHNTGAVYMYFCAKPQGNLYSADCRPCTNNLGQTSSVNPYMDATSPQHFINPDSFQLICAGKDGLFGPGGFWRPAFADAHYPTGSPGADDLANFHPVRLGIAVP
jgi:prepilin-type N-terminal cleavage/methylation domain-containing protein